jgi:tetratricopeptide (TPR) repeat protein
MLKPLEQFRNFLGEGRFWMLVGVLVTTGIASFALAVADYEQTITTQTILALGGISGATAIIGTRLNGEQRRQGLAIIAPAIGIVALGVLFFPQYILAVLGAAAGWVVAGFMIFGRSNAPIQYRDAIKAMRKGDFKTAVATLDELIKVETDNPNHYRLRGRVLRLWGKPGRARHDYEAMLQYSTHDGIQAEAYNEISELELQSKNYEQALEAAQKASDLLPQDWVAAYNLGMIQDRLGQSEAAIASLERALAVKVKDARHHLLIYLWLARANARLGQLDKAKSAVEILKGTKSSLAEWDILLKSEEAVVLRDMLGADIELAQKLIHDEIDVTQLAK